MINWILSSFHRKIALILLVTILPIVIAYTTYEYQSNKIEIQSNLKQQSNQLISTLSILIREDIRYNKPYQLWENINHIFLQNKKILDESRSLFYIKEIAVINNKQEVLGHTDPKNHALLSKYHSHLVLNSASEHASFFGDNDVYTETVPILYGAEKIGSLIISFDHEPARIQLSKAFLKYVYTILLVVVTIVFLVFTIAHFIHRPLLLITEQIRNIGDNNINLLQLTSRKDEFGRLANALQLIDHQLFTDKHLIQTHSDNLERLVEERTSQLVDTQIELVKSERLAVLGQLTATVSHELRNPLGAIRPSLYVLRKKITDPDEKTIKAMDRIDRNVQRCDHIVDELLDFARIKELELSQFELNGWLKDIVNELNLHKDIDVHWQLSSTQIDINADTNRFRRVIINLVENASHAMLEKYEVDKFVAGSKLSISTSENNNQITIIISDNGCGMNKEIQNQIFTPLFSTKGFGVGLGLPAVKKIMEQHGGEISISSVETSGTTVTITLPCNSELNT